jgi:curved DNA-binding protein CbpA
MLWLLLLASSVTPSEGFFLWTGGHQHILSVNGETPRTPRLNSPQLHLSGKPRHARASVRRFAFGQSSEFVDYYAVLGLTDTASDKEIKRAYRRCATKFHPDVNPNGGEQFAKICAAYEVLKDPTARTKHDRNRRARGSGGSSYAGGASSSSSSKAAGGGRNYASGGQKRDFSYERPEDIDDSFGSIFGDLFGTVVGSGVGAAAAGVAGRAAGRAVSGGGSGRLFEDLVSFLERQTEGFGADMGETSAEFDDLLQRGSAAELRAELEADNTLLAALQKRRADAQADAAKASANKAAADAVASGSGSADVRLAALERAADAAADLAAAKARDAELKAYLERASRRQKRLELRLVEIGGGGSDGGSSNNNGGYRSSSGSSGAYSSSGSSSGSTRASSSYTKSGSSYQEPPHRRARPDADPSAKAKVESELERLKREMGRL